MPHSLNYDWYKYYIFNCNYTNEAEDYLDEASEDPFISIDEYTSLANLVIDLIEEGKLM